MDFIVDGFWKQIIWWAYMMDFVFGFDMISKSQRYVPAGVKWLAEETLLLLTILSKTIRFSWFMSSFIYLFIIIIIIF